MKADRSMIAPTDSEWVRGIIEGFLRAIGDYPYARYKKAPHLGGAPQ